MKTSKIAISLLGIVALTSVAAAAKAEDFAFNQFVGKVYVKTVNVAFADNGVTLSTIITAPSCPNQQHIDGSVTVTYSNNGGWASKTWRFVGSDEENKDHFYSSFVPYRQTPGGRVNVETSARCVYHGIRHGGIRLPF